MRGEKRGGERRGGERREGRGGEERMGQIHEVKPNLSMATWPLGPQTAITLSILLYLHLSYGPAAQNQPSGNEVKSIAGSKHLGFYYVVLIKVLQ